MLKRLGRAFARLRRERDTGVPVDTAAAAHREAAIVAIPWRSSPFWDEYDLSVHANREADRFQFYAEMGDGISVRAEAAPPGRGLRVRVFSGQQGETPAEASSDEHGVVELFVLARSGGMHSVEVKLDTPRNERPRSYRLSIDAARSRRPAGGTRSHAPEFVDVPVGHRYREAVTTVVAAGVMNGSEEWWQFAPDAPVTRVELAEMVRDSLGSAGSGAVPVLLADLATQDRLKGILRVLPRVSGPPDAQVVATSGGSAGVSSEARLRAAPIARAQAVSLIVRALERYRPGVLRRPPRGYSSVMASTIHRLHVRIAEYNGLMEGLEGFGLQWDPRLAVSRGEVAQLLSASMSLQETTAESAPREVPPTRPLERTDGGVAPDLAGLGVQTTEYLQGAHEEIDRLMAESGTVDEPSLPGEAPLPDVSLALDRAHVRREVEQTRDRLRAQVLGPPGSVTPVTPHQETDGPADI